MLWGRADLSDDTESIVAELVANAVQASERDATPVALRLFLAAASVVVEVFAVGGRTPPNSHVRAHEFFYVLHGQGRALCGGRCALLRRGDALLVRPGVEHVIENTGPGKLYTLTVMTPNEGFAELIRGGERIELDADDIRVLQGS